MNEPEFSTFMDGHHMDDNEHKYTPTYTQNISPQQVAQLVLAIQEILRNPDGLYLYKHDPIFHSLVRRLEFIKESRQSIPIEFFANLIKEICEGAFRSVQHALQLAKKRGGESET